MPKSKKPSNLKHTVLDGGGSRKKSKKFPHPRPRDGHVAGTDQWHVEDILAYKMNAESSLTKMVYFLVKWEHYDVGESTWEAALNLSQSWHLVVDFMKERGKKIAVDRINKAMTVEDLGEDDEAGQEQEPLGEEETAEKVTE